MNLYGGRRLGGEGRFLQALESFFEEVFGEGEALFAAWGAHDDGDDAFTVANGGDGDAEFGGANVSCL